MKRTYLSIFIIFILCAIHLYSFAQETNQEEPTGKIVFCQHDGQYWQIWIMDLDGSNKKQLTNSKIDKRSPNLSSDGQKIVFVTNDGNLWKMDSDGSNITAIPLSISAAEPKWCFQDKRIVFTSYRGVSFLDDSDIWLVNPVKNAISNGVNSDAPKLEKIIRRPSLQFLPDISKNTEEILFVEVLESVGHKIFKYNLKTKDCIQLSQGGLHDTTPVFVADGERIVYSSDKDGNYDIWIMGRFGQHQKNLTHRAAFDSSPVITKDAKTIFFLSDNREGMQIWSMDFNGKKLKQITNDSLDKQDISVYAP